MRFKQITLVCVLWLLACGQTGGGSGDELAEGGIGGSGISNGPIDAFGSIFVNGIEWEIDESQIEFDGAPGAEENLRLGMVVRVEGEIDRANKTGEATKVFFDDELEGPVADITLVADSNGQIKELTVLGRRIWIELGVTHFDDDDLSGFGFDSIVVGDVIEVSGLIDADDVVRATHIEREGDVVLGETEVEVRGVITGYDDVSSFMIGDVTITFDDDTELDDLPGGVIANGLEVEVEGVLTSANEIAADEIEADDDFDDEDYDELSTTGFVSNFVSLSDFLVGGLQVDASSAEFEHGSAAMLENGVRVEVEGDLVDGILIAEEVEFEGREVEISAAVALEADVQPEENRLFLLGVEVRVTSATQIEDSLGEFESFTLDDIQEGDFLEIEAAVVADGVVTATQIERNDVDDVKIEGPVDSFDSVAGTLEILGVTFSTQSGTEYEIEDGSVLRAAFYAALEVGDFVSIDDEVDGDASSLDFATEVELEGN